MKHTLAPVLATLALFATGCEGDISTDNSSVLGLQPPGMTPELFAPGLVSTDALEALPAISPDMRDFYFIRQGSDTAPGYRVVSYRDGEISEMALEGIDGSGEVFISPDGTTMHFGNMYKERTSEGWSESISLGAPYDQIDIMRLTSSASGTYVFDERDEIGTIRYARLIDGQREEPVAFPEQINSGAFTAHPFIAPDESYLIWDSEREDGFGGADLYISFRSADGSWGSAINMGESINSAHDDIFGSVTSDGKYFIFNRINLGEEADDSTADIYWVSAQVIENLRPQSED